LQEKYAEKRTHNPNESPALPPKRQALDVAKCLFCERSDDGVLREVSTFDADHNIRAMITELGDPKLMTRIVGGDLIASEAKYHLQCLVKLRNQYRSLNRKVNQNSEDTDEKMNESRTFVELTNDITKAVESGINLFKLTELHSLYIGRLKELGVEKQVNKTRLKCSLLEHFPEAQQQHDGKQTFIIFKEGMKDMLKEALKKRDYDDDAVVLAKAAKIIRNDILNHDGFDFTGSFSAGCQSKSIPSSLKYLLTMIMKNPNMKDQGKSESQACLTVGQAIVYNTTKKSPSAGKSRHSREREPPLPIYIGMNVHMLTRSKKLIHQLYQMGLSISYDRIMQIEDWIATSACERFEADGVVVPSCLSKGVFTVGALDNLDHNPSSTTSVNSFHGTAISLFQLPTKTNSGENRPPIKIPPAGSSKAILPDYYSIVPAVALNQTTAVVPECSIMPNGNQLDNARTKEHNWISQSVTLLEMEESFSRERPIAWAAYHASLQPALEEPPANCALLPLFYEKSATPAMIKHGMDIQRKAIQFLNPGQVPITTLDQPLFALAKAVQWTWPETHGEQMHVVMLGGLHTEMALWNTLGDLLDGCGWTAALTEADIASSGTAASFLRAAHLTRTRHAHQVTLLALHKLQSEAFRLVSGSNNDQSFEDWKNHMVKTSPTFMFWDLIMRYETLILIFIRAHREKNFLLYIEVLEELVPLFFALNHVHYARWLPVHIRDMKSLPVSVRDEFVQQSHWVVSKTHRKFSAMPFDQAHEQENKTVKGPGGAVGLTENPSAFRRWMLSGPEMARLLKEFEEEYIEEDDTHCLHHEQSDSSQNKFHRQVLSLTDTIKQMGNPFTDDFQELVALDSRNCVNDSVIKTMRSIEETGKKQYASYVNEVFLERTTSIHDRIKRNSLSLFSTPESRIVPKKSKLNVLQNNVALFGQLYISMQNRQSDLDEFFAHEIQSFPASLSEFGMLHLPGTKSDLLHCLDTSTCPEPRAPSAFDCKVLDGAVIVHCLPTFNVSTFDMYADEVFIPYLQRQLQDAKRLDVVWDEYIKDSLKESTRQKRGKGARRKVSGSAKIPGNWISFLADQMNKKELFTFLTCKIKSFSWPSTKTVYVTSGEEVASCGPSVPMDDCNHEEADTRIMVHIQHAVDQGAKTFLVRTVDTDVVVILAGLYFQLVTNQQLCDLWVAFGMGKKFRFYHINNICENLGEPRSRALPVFHALSGCDTTSAFHGKGKKSAWQTWQVYSDVTATFANLARNPFTLLDVDSNDFQKIERFTVLLYDQRSDSFSVNETRKRLFCQENRAMEKLPPTQDALLQHARRAIFQAGIWTTSTNSQQVLPSPHLYGWKKESGASTWIPVWTTIPEISRACRELIKCCCTRTCTSCKCAKASLPCSPLCKCKCF
jgi:hypothetical protein